MCGCSSCFFFFFDAFFFFFFSPVFSMFLAACVGCMNSSVDMVELAKIMEMVLDVVKRHSSHSSEIFWRDVGDLGAMLFGERLVKHGKHARWRKGKPLWHSKCWHVSCVIYSKLKNYWWTDTSTSYITRQISCFFPFFYFRLKTCYRWKGGKPLSLGLWTEHKKWLGRFFVFYRKIARFGRVFWGGG